MVILLNAKTTLNAAAFDIILKDYQEHIESHWHFTSWMHNNITTIFPDIEDYMISAFKFQNQNFNVHYSELDHHFQLKNIANKLDNNDVIKYLETTFSETDIKNKVSKLNDDHSLKSNSSTPSKEKKTLVIDDDIALFLLKTQIGLQPKQV